MVASGMEPPRRDRRLLDALPTTYIARRLLQSIPLLLVISAICFTLMNLAPGGPLAHLESNPEISAEDIARKRALLGLDRPLPIQYGLWLKRMLIEQDFGESFQTKRPNLEMIAERIPATLELMLTAFALALSVGLVLGVCSAVWRATVGDYFATLFAFIGISIPVFWLGQMAQLVFGVKLHWLPITGRATPGMAPNFGDHLSHLVMPVCVLSLLYMASWSRYMRGSLVEVLSQDYIRTARAKGLAPLAVLLRHGVRNALIPVVTIVALQVPSLFMGAIITETIFAWPGMGNLFYEGILNGDYPLLMAILVISSTLIVVFNLIADVLYGLLDPRIAFK